VGTLRATTNLTGHAVNGIALGEPIGDGPYTWSHERLPDGDIVGGNVVATGEDGKTYTAATVTAPEAHAAAVADAAAAAAAETAAVEAAAVAREENIDAIPVIAAAVDDLIVAVLTP
jgi:hypothetical protein